ncbi:MAG TPA: beta-propeller fold lactonase family protein, partial [Pirellulaceae bacterium]|nr:beta-propeller fold lactonase family protein [Pirellulaceae bacterium]
LPAAERLLESKVNRSPVDLVLGPNSQWLVTINQGSSTASLVDPQTGRVLDEVAVGKHPTAIIRDEGGRDVYISSRDSGTITILTVADDRLTVSGQIEVGMHPHGLALGPAEMTLYVALTAADQVGVINLKTRELVEKIDCGRWPRWLALSPDGKRLAVASSGDRGISVIDCHARKLLFHDAFAGVSVGHVSISKDGEYAYFPWMVYRANPISEVNIKLGWVLASRLGRIKLAEKSRREAFSLDPPGKAIADVHGLALSSNDKRLVVSAAGTHELLVYRNTDLPFKDYGGTDHIEPALLADAERFTRIPLGGRPLGLRIAEDDHTVYVANYFHNAIQVVDIDSGKVVRELSLGPAPELSLARRGEVIFYDATRSLDQWYSCHSCHYEGGLASDRMDTTNDGSRNTFKTVLPLYNFSKTAPWTWHGWQTDERAAMRKSLTETMLGPKPTGDDIDALLAYFGQLAPPPNPFRPRDGKLSPAAERGQKVFASETAGCANCHSGDYFTDGENHDVGLGARGDAYKGFNTPSLIGVYERVKLLHDGRAASLREALTGPHSPAKVTGRGDLTDEQLTDLIEYLKTL